MRGHEWLVGKEAELQRNGEVGEIVDVEEINVDGESEHRVTVELEDGREFNTDRSRVEVMLDA